MPTRPSPPPSPRWARRCCAPQPSFQNPITKASMNIVGPQQRLSTRLAFLVAGLAMSAWAPLVPYAKARVGLDEGGLVLLPGLACAPSAALLAVNLFLFGAAIGTLDVAMNVQAVIVERDSGGALMSGFHGLFSVGGFVGAGSMALMLWGGLAPLAAAAVLAFVSALLLAGAAPYLLREPDHAGAGGPLFVMPHGAVIFIGVLCFIVFLAEGAMLDWSAL